MRVQELKQLLDMITYDCECYVNATFDMNRDMKLLSVQFTKDRRVILQDHITVREPREIQLRDGNVYEAIWP